MTAQTQFAKSLGGSPAGAMNARWLTLTLVAMMACSAMTGAAQDQPAAANSGPAKQGAAKSAKGADTKPVSALPDKTAGNYQIHSMVELGGRFTERSGSSAMWATTINQGSGGRVLGQSLDMRTLDRRKTPFFDTLSTSSFGYGGDPYDVSRLKVTKGRLYDFTGSFRRDRNYFDYNLHVNSLLGPNALVPEPDSLHIYNTVRRNTSTLLTLLPTSMVHVRAGFDHNTNEGPSYSSVHEGGDVQVLQWFRHSLDTYIAGLDVNVAKRSTVSYDQFFGMYRGDSPYRLAGPIFRLADGTPSSVGVDLLASAMCGSGANKTLAVVGGVVNPYCSQTLVQSQTAPTRTTFPTEQVRFSSHYFDKVSFNGRFSYSGDAMNVNHFNETFTGLLTRTFLRQEVDTGGMSNGRLAHNKRDSSDGDLGVEAELGEHFAVTDAVTYRNFRVEGNNTLTTELWAGTASTKNLNVFTPISTLTPVTTTTANNYFLDQKMLGNTVLGIVTVTPQFKFSGGWRFNNREIADPGDDLTWHQNWMLLGAVIQPSSGVRITVNYDTMNSKAANADTPSDTYTREAPNKIQHLRARAVVKPAKWINFAVAGNDYMAKNNDPLVNHNEHARDISFATQIIPSEWLSVDLNFAHDDVFSVTDLCYLTTASPAPYNDHNAGTCVPSDSNPNATSNLLLGNGYYDAPSTYFAGGANIAPSKYFRLNGGVRINNISGSAEFLSPYQVPGALQSKTFVPYTDLLVNIAPGWAWHGNWIHQSYQESGAAGPAPRNYAGDIFTLGVKYAF